MVPAKTKSANFKYLLGKPCGREKSLSIFSQHLYSFLNIPGKIEQGIRAESNF
jgi:hypothetical protein